MIHGVHCDALALSNCSYQTITTISLAPFYKTVNMMTSLSLNQAFKGIQTLYKNYQNTRRSQKHMCIRICSI